MFMKEPLIIGILFKKLSAAATLKTSLAPKFKLYMRGEDDTVSSYRKAFI